MTIRRRALALPLVLLLGASGCGSSDDPFTTDMKMICNAGRDPTLPPDMRTLAGFREIADKVRTAEAARLMSELMQAHPSEREAMLAPALAKAKLKRCPFLQP